MGTDVIFFGWNRPIPGREQLSVEHFQEFVGYLGGLQQAGTIESWEPVLLATHGGDLNGFFLIRGEGAELGALQASDEWLTHMTRAGLHAQGTGAIRGVSGEGVMEWMERYGSLIPD